MVAPRQSQVTHQDPSVYELLDPGNCLPRSTVTWKFFNFLLHGHAQAVARQDPPQGRHIDTLTQAIARQGLPWYGGFPTFYFMITVGFPFLQPDAQRHKYSIKWGGKTEFTICGMAVNSCGARKLRGYSPSACCAPVTRPLVALGSSPELLAFTMLLPPPVRQCVAWFLLRWGWVFLERTRILSGIQLTSHFIINFCVVETKRFVSSTVNVILMRQTCGQRSSRAAESKRRALGNYFSERICYMLLISKYRETEIKVRAQLRDLRLENRSAMAPSGKKTCFDAGKTGFCHCAAVLQTQVPKLCTDLDLRPIRHRDFSMYNKCFFENWY